MLRKRLSEFLEEVFYFPDIFFVLGIKQHRNFHILGEQVILFCGIGDLIPLWIFSLLKTSAFGGGAQLF